MKASGGQKYLKQEHAMADKKVLLSVLAHPDDESFGMGGTLALYAEQGVEIHLICATRGEVGEVAAEYLQNYPSIAALREAELTCAAAHLGLAKVHFLDYRDSGMPGSPDNEHPKAFVAAPIEEVAAQVANLMRELKPQVVLTFDPIGGYRHPDHIHIHKATVEAFDMAGDPNFQDGLPPFKPDRLYFHTISRRFLRVAVRLLKLLRKDPSKWGQNQDIDLTSLAVEDFPVHAQIQYPNVEQRKAAASACHASQGGVGLAKGPLVWILRLFAGKATDTFMQAYPEPENGKVVRDLFEGI
jgi:N-acetyl-1-D-myo-inositol-2-amino-2-deoxy-alpha-D-glucopyranoside deacetylase